MKARGGLLKGLPFFDTIKQGGNMKVESAVKMKARIVIVPKIGAVVSVKSIPSTTRNGTVIAQWGSRIFRTYHGTIGVMIPLNRNGNEIRAGKASYIGGDRTGLSAEQWKLRMFR